MKTHMIIVDDSLDYGTLLSHCFLDREDISLSLFNDPRNALHHIKHLDKTTHTLVVSDVMMPHIDGIELIEEIKKARPNTKVCLLSSCRDSKTINKAYEIGVCEYILKDRTKDEIVCKINSIIDNDLKETPEHIEVYEITDVISSYEIIETLGNEITLTTPEEVSLNSIISFKEGVHSHLYKVEKCEIVNDRPVITCKSIS